MRLSSRKLSAVRSLSTKKGRRKYNAFIASGIRIVDEAIRAQQPIQFLLVAGSELTTPGRQFLEKLAGLDVFEISAKDLRRIDRSESSQGVVAVITMRKDPSNSQMPRSGAVLALDAVSDPSNLGAILRSALAFKFECVLLGQGCTELYSPKVVRASAGSLFHLNCLSDIDLMEKLPILKSWGYSIIGTDKAGIYPEDALKRRGSPCLVIGNEALGMSPAVSALCDYIMGIPMAPRCESLSAPVAAGIAMYEISRKHHMIPNERNIEHHKP